MTPDHVTSAWHCNICSKLFYTFEKAQECEGEHMDEYVPKMKILEWIEECSVPVMDEGEMDKFIEKNKDCSIYRIVNFEKLKVKIVEGEL